MPSSPRSSASVWKPTPSARRSSARTMLNTRQHYAADGQRPLSPDRSLSPTSCSVPCCSLMTGWRCTSLAPCAGTATMWYCLTTKLREMMKEVVRADRAGPRVPRQLDYFDASINRISAWVTGLHCRAEGASVRAARAEVSQKASGREQLHRADGTAGGAQDSCRSAQSGRNICAVKIFLQDYFSEIKRYEADVLSKR